MSISTREKATNEKITHASFGALVDWLKANNVKDYWVNQPVTVEASKDISGIRWHFQGTGKFVCASGAVLTGFTPAIPYAFQIIDCALADVPTISGVEYVTPEMFGVTGASDDVGINKAVQSFLKVCLISTYVVVAPVNLRSGSVIFGNGTIRSASSTVWNDTGFLQAVTVSNIKISDVTLDGNKANNASGRSYGIRISAGTNDVLIDNVKSINHPGLNSTGVNGGDGLYIEPAGTRCYDITARDCVFTGNVRNNVSIISGKSISLIRCNCSGATGNNVGGGIDIEPDVGTSESWSENITIDDCDISDNYVGIQVYNTKLASIKNIYIKNCRINSNTTRGIRLHSVNDGSDGGEVVINNNAITDNGERGIFLDSYAAFGGYSKNIKIVDNYIHNNGQQGIYFDQDVRYCSVIGNTITRNGFDGIRVDWATNGSSMHHVIECNHILNNSVASTGTYHGVKLFGNSGVTPTAYCSVQHNYIGNRQFINSTATQQDGVFIGEYSDNNLISHNHFLACLGRGVYVDPAADNNTVSDNIFVSIVGYCIEIDTGASKSTARFNRFYSITEGTEILDNGSTTSILHYDNNGRVKMGINVDIAGSACGLRIEEPTGTIPALIVKKTDTTQGNGAIAKFQNTDSTNENSPVIINEGNSATDDGSPLCVGANSGTSLRLSGAVKISTNQVITTRQTGVAAMTNLTAPANLDADTVTVAQLADIVGNLISKLRTHGLVGD